MRSRSMMAVLSMVAVIGNGAGCSTMSTSPSLRTVDRVDLDRYLGRWNVIAAVPNVFERGKVGTADVYARRPDGRLTANYVFRKGSLDAPEQEWKGVAWVTNKTTNAAWKVQLFWPFTADYWILELDPDYRWSVVASRGGKWLWVLARERSLDDDTYNDIVRRIERRGLDAKALVRIPQPNPGR